MLLNDEPGCQCMTGQGCLVAAASKTDPQVGETLQLETEVAVKIRPHAEALDGKSSCGESW